MTIERTFTQAECTANGGHFWSEWDASQTVDPKTFSIDYSAGQIAVYYPNGAPRFRGCPLCGRVEKYIPGRWVEC